MFCYFLEAYSFLMKDRMRVGTYGRGIGGRWEVILDACALAAVGSAG